MQNAKYLTEKVAFLQSQTLEKINALSSNILFFPHWLMNDSLYTPGIQTLLVTN